MKSHTKKLWLNLDLQKKISMGNIYREEFMFSRRRVPAQDGLFALILWYRVDIVKQ